MNLEGCSFGAISNPVPKNVHVRKRRSRLCGRLIVDGRGGAFLWGNVKPLSPKARLSLGPPSWVQVCSCGRREEAASSCVSWHPFL